MPATATIEDVDGRKSFAFNQVDYIADESGQWLVDFVGRYEHLSRDAARVFTRLRLPDLQLPHVNRSQHRHYSEYYTAETRSIVAARFARDIEAFGYRFETPAPGNGTLTGTHAARDSARSTS